MPVLLTLIEQNSYIPTNGNSVYIEFAFSIKELSAADSLNLGSALAAWRLYPFNITAGHIVLSDVGTLFYTSQSALEIHSFMSIVVPIASPNIESDRSDCYCYYMCIQIE